MTKEEKQKAIGALEISRPFMVVTQEQYDEYIQILNKIKDWLEQESPNGDAISRKLVYAFLFGLISDDDERKKALEYINELPPVNHQETVTEFADRCRECGKMRRKNE